MAQVPQATNTTVAVDAIPNARQQVNTSDAAFGGTQAKQIQQIGNAGMDLGSVALRMQRQAEVAEVDTLLHTDLKAATDGITLAASARKLQAAVGVSADGLAEFDKKVGEVGAKLKTSRQQEYFRISAAKGRVALMGALERHQLTQLNEAEVVGREAAIDRAGGYVLLNPTLGNLQLQLPDIQAESAALARMKGLTDPKLVAEFVQGRVGKVFASLTDSMMDSDPGQAAQLVQHATEQGWISKGDSAFLGGKLNKALDTREVEAFAQMTVQPGVDLATAQEAARKRFEGRPDKITKALQAVEQQYAIRDRGITEGQNQAYDDALGLLANDKRVPPSVFERMSGAQRLSIRDRQRQSVGLPRSQDGEIQGRLEYEQALELARENPDKFKNSSLAQLYPNLSSGQFGTLTNMRQDLLDGGPEAITLIQDLDVVKDSLKLKPDSTGYAQLRGWVYGKVAAETKLNGKPPSRERRLQILAEAQLPVGEHSVYSDAFGGDTRKKLYQTFSNGKVGRVAIGTIQEKAPQDYLRIRAQIEAMQNGVRATDTQIEKQYNAELNGATP